MNILTIYLPLQAGAGRILFIIIFSHILYKYALMVIVANLAHHYKGFFAFIFMEYDGD
ncbi:hypothetical protein PTI45_03098 [Paenibacillus nuruki]|uniref:Uncharacterized protein n=1 Tax=Paenibacillus nuruki TaxID=1886670 RepID=A0A1E3L1D0_9BACL|nr:hypothetical protein PTI45_03098 [Paenibacillus nuruki]